MNFRLDPSSGLADSYLDVEFSISWDEKIPDYEKAIIHIHNETSGDQLQILGTSFGYILNGDNLVLKSRSATTGHINIFNQDKMNKKFLAHRSVTLKCVVEYYDKKDNKVAKEEDFVIFYNEMHSLDADIIPFDLVIHNRTISLTDNQPLRLDVISDGQRKYELCISSLDERIRCHIEVFAREGKTSVEIPGEFLYYDLGIRENRNKKFKFYYVKHQGTTLSRVSNKRYMPIQNTELKFQLDGGMTPNPQKRLDPGGKLLDKNFVISDRYLVMCSAAHSGFARKGEFSPEKLMDLTMMTNEGQHMYALSKQIKTFEADKDSENINKTEKSLQLAQQSKQKMRRPRISSSQIQLMRNVSRVYDSISSNKIPQTQKPKTVQSFSANKAVKPDGGGCAPCSRKRKQNA